MKNTLLYLLAICIMAACSEPIQEAESVEPVAQTILEKKKSPTPPPIVFTPVFVDSTDWNITYDTSVCGSLLMRWTDQNRPAGSSNYFFVVNPQASTCSGGLSTTTNVLFYTYGFGCSFWPNSSYDVSIRYTWKDSAKAKIYVYTSTSVPVRTGRSAWECNN